MTTAPDAPATTAAPDTTPAPPSRLRTAAKLLGVSLVIPVLAAVALGLFAWPVSQLAPRDLPIGLAGPTQMTAPLAGQLAKAAGSDAFDVHQYADEAAARAAIKDREIYGAIVAGPRGVTLLTASAASPLVSQLLTQAVTAQAARAGQGGQPAAVPKVVDVVRTTSEDPRGVVLGAALLPLVLVGLMTGILVSTVARAGWGQVIGLVVASALAGLAGVAVAQEWLGAFGGDWWLNAGVLGLTVLAIGAVVTGLADLIGPAGLGLGAALMMLVGNPFSGVTSAPELLPRWAGITGQLLPPGAGGNLLRSSAYFDNAAALRPAMVLVGWVAIGLACLTLGTLRRHGRSGIHRP